jgi:hypothetical protein
MERENHDHGRPNLVWPIICWATSRVRTLLPFLSVGLVIGCDRNPGPTNLAISDATQTNALCLVSPHRGGFVSGLTLHIQGHLDGTGYVYAANWPTQALSGAIDWRMYEDYFQNSCVVHYHPVGVRTGSLSILYEFR